MTEGLPLHGQVARRLAAILAADVVGSSRLIEADENYALGAIRHAIQGVLVNIAKEHGGRLIKTTGDGALLEFASPVAAVTCALEVQKQLAAEANVREVHRRVLLRIGINMGDVVAEPDGDLYGDGVNVAARLESIADAGGIAISAKVKEELRGKLDAAFEDRGEQHIKNISRPVRVYAALGTSQALPRTVQLPSTSIAVMPFANVGDNADQDYFADGLADEIITALSRVRWIGVISRTSTFAYKGRAIDVREVSRDLGARYVLEGSVRRAGDRLRIHGQLSDATTGRTIWADRYDGPMADVFDLQDRVTQSVVAALEPALQTFETSRAAAKPTESLEAYDLYLLGLSQFYKGTDADLLAAHRLLQEAVDKDRRFAAAKATLARVTMQRYSQGVASSLEVSNAVCLAEEVIREARDDPTALRIAGNAVAYLTGDHALGLVAVRRAVALNPNSAQILFGSASVHYYAGEDDTAIAQLQDAIRLSPNDPELPQFHAMLSWAFLAKQDYDSAIDHGQQSLRLNPAYTTAYRATCAALVTAGRVGEARALARSLLALTPSFRLSTHPFPRRPDAARAAVVDSLRTAGIPD